ncbi:regulatory protein [Streptomyces zinciresistens K42]|uniref:Regulatory protein n=1 Tax=Streptomyces zinciresistens K42 TaxID=700597 RepID=G2G6G3_9ACTN|nr:GAF and ANTAR domain-containing protein [Streptomyces zinciresistens]EGX60854.1 regulatory protein [Streptomyces zinciresistens K42]
MRPGDDPRGERGREPPGAADAIAEGVRGARVGEIPGRLCGVAVDLLPVTCASVSLHSAGVPVQLGASSAQAAYVTEVQATLGDAPCHYVARTGTAVLARDLTAGRDVLRWPVFAQQATAAGVRAVYSLPLGDGAVCVGTLDLYRDRPGTLTDPELRTARLVAGLITAALTALPRAREDDEDGREWWLGGLGAGHDSVHQATGMIMAQLGLGTDEALARLRAHAFAHGRTALDLARDVVARRTRFER